MFFRVRPWLILLLLLLLFPCLCFCCFRVFPCHSVAKMSFLLLSFSVSLLLSSSVFFRVRPWLILLLLLLLLLIFLRFQHPTNNSSTKSPCQPAPPPSFRLVYINTPKEPNHGYSRFLPLHSLRTFTQTRFLAFMRPLQIHGGHSQVIPPQARLDSPLGCPPKPPFPKSKTPKASFLHLIYSLL